MKPVHYEDCGYWRGTGISCDCKANADRDALEKELAEAKRQIEELKRDYVRQENFNPEEGK